MADQRALFTIDALPEELLVEIFGRLPREDQALRLAVPLVCRRWRALCAVPRLNESVYIDFFRSNFQLNATPRLALAANWVAARAASLRDLTLDLPTGAPALPGLLVGAIAAACREPQLHHLNVHFKEGGVVAACDLLMALGQHTRVGRTLQTLSLRCPLGPQEALLPEGLQFPLLRRLTLRCEEDESYMAQNLPKGLNSLLLGCQDLAALELHGAGAGLPRETLKGLTQLQWLTRLCLLDIDLYEVPASLSAMTNLRSLQVVTTYRAPNMWAALARLTRLTSLELKCSRLPAMLRAPGLKRLTLWRLRSFLPDKETAFAWLLDGLQLEELGLPHCRLGDVPTAVIRQSALRSLDLRSCRLSELPSGPYLQQLTRLDLSGNCCGALPDAALSAPQLQSLIFMRGEAPLPVRQLRSRAGALESAVEKAEDRMQKDFSEESSEVSSSDEDSSASDSGNDDDDDDDDDYQGLEARWLDMAVARVHYRTIE